MSCYIYKGIKYSEKDVKIAILKDEGGVTPLDTIGLDLSSPAYAQRPNESDEDWNTRLLDEVVAYVTAPEIAAKLGDLKNNDPSLWKQITDFIKQLTDWLKSQIGLSDYKGNIMDMSKEEYISALGISILKDDYTSSEKAQEYFTREADRLPLTLSVFSRPEFVKMQGTNVNPITVLNFLNQSGIKQVEKDLIKQIIEDNYQGQKKISYDELEATVRANIMPLERIFTSSYADYGMNNLGTGDYGNANTIILNAPVEHGVIGHFSGDFKASGRKNIKYVPKQLNDNTWVAVEEGYESQANDNNIYQFVGTAGTKEAVESWIENYEDTDISYNESNTKVEREIDEDGDKVITIKGKNSEHAIGAFQAKTDEEFNRSDAEILRLFFKDKGYINRPNYTDVNKGMFGHIRVWQDGTVFNVAELQSDYFQKNKAKENIVYSSKEYLEGMVEAKRVLEEELAEREERGELTRREATAIFIDEVVKIQTRYEKGFMEKLSIQEKQFIASQKEWEKRMVREVIKEASLSGATSLRFPTPYTLSVIEGYVSPEGLSGVKPPYEILPTNFWGESIGDVDYLPTGSLIKYLGKEYLILSSLDNSNIEIAPNEGIYSWYYEVNTIDAAIMYNRTDKTEQQLKKGLLGLLKKGIENGYITNIVDARDVTDLLLGIRSKIEAATQTLRQPHMYEVVGKDAFDIETSLDRDEEGKQEIDRTQRTVAYKYQEIANILRQEKGDNFEVVTDKNGFDWYETKITPEEVNKPVVAFNIVGQKATQQNQDLLNSYSKALDLEAEGKTPVEIELETGWFKEEGDWKYFSKETLKNFKIKSNFVVKIGTFNYTDVIENKELIKMYPSLKNVKIEFYEGAKETDKSKRNANAVRSNGDILVNLDRLDYGTEGGGRTLYSRMYPDNRGFLANSKNLGYQIGASIVHETQHHIQEEENFPKGGDIYTLFDKVSKYTKQDDPRLGIVRDNLTELLKDKKNLTETQVKEMKAVVNFLNTYFDGGMDQSVYKLLLGEVEARFLQNLHKEGFDENKSFFQLREEFEIQEGIFERDKFVVRGEDIEPLPEFSEEINNRAIEDFENIMMYRPESVSLDPEKAQENFDKLNECNG